MELARSVENIYTESVRAYSVPSRNNPDGSVSIPVQPVFQVDAKELLKFTSVIITAAASTTLWIPTIGKRARIKGFSIAVDPATTSAAGCLITLTDGGVAIDNIVALGVGAPGTPLRFAGAFPGEGLRSSGVNNLVAVNLSAALTAGGVYLNVWGVEE